MRYLFAFLLLLIFTFGVMPSVALAQSQADFSFEGLNKVSAQVVNHSPSFWLLSNFIADFTEQGVDPDVLYLILAVPFVTFLIAFFRQVIGVSTFGLHTPTLIALSFVLLGITFGLGVLLLVILVSYLLRNIVGKLHLLYIPRTSFLLSTIALSFLVVIWFGVNFGSPVAIGFAIFPMLMISTISERIASAQLEEGISEALKGTFQTIGVSVVAYYFVYWPWLHGLVISYPEVVILPMLGSLLLGKFTGLRLIEYFRFRTLFKDNIEE